MEIHDFLCYNNRCIEKRGNNMTNGKTLVNNLTEGPLTKQLLLFSMPLVLGNLLHTLYNLVDMAVVGQFVGSVGLSAVSTSGQITMLLYCLGIGLGSGGQILIAQQVGAGDRDGVRTTIGTSFTFTVLLSLVVTAVGLLLNQTMLRLMNTPEEAWTDAVEYMFWCCLGIPFTYLNGGLSALLRGMGDSKHPTYFVAAAALTNVVLDLLFVAVFDMRAKGAAIATSIAQLVGAVACVVYLYRHRDELGFDFKLQSFRMERRTLSTILRLSAPLAVQTIAINVSMLFVNAWINAFGVVVSAANGVGSKLSSIANVITNAMQSAVATFTGQNMAARRHERVGRAMKVAQICCLAFWAVLVFCCVFLPRETFGLFTTEEAVLDMAPGYMSVQIVMYLTFATMSTPLGFINGVGHVNLNLIIALVDGIVARIGLCMLLSAVLDIGPYAYWWANALAGFVSVVWGWAYYASGKWKNRRLLTD